MVAGTEKAAEFYGSFSAAIVAAIAVILSVYYQAHLTRQRDIEIHQRERLGDAIELHYWFQYCESRLESNARRLSEIAAGIKNGATPVVPRTYKTFRNFIAPIPLKEMEGRLRISADYPISVADNVATAFQALSRITDMAAPEIYPDDRPFQPEQMLLVASFLREAHGFVTMAREKLDLFIRMNNIPIPSTSHTPEIEKRMRERKYDQP